MPPRCFVAMPFNATFQSRYADEFKPAIEAAGLEAYKVDDDHGADRLIDDIEREIAAAAVVLVDITEDNPNVWYELGYSQALKKPLLLVSCSNERGVKEFPFDIRSRSVIVYTSNLRKGLEKLQKDVTERIKRRLAEHPTPTPTPTPLPPSPVVVAALAQAPSPSIDERALGTHEVQRVLKGDASPALAAIQAIGGLAGAAASAPAAAAPGQPTVAERLRAMPEVREMVGESRLAKIQASAAVVASLRDGPGTFTPASEAVLARLRSTEREGEARGRGHTNGPTARDIKVQLDALPEVRAESRFQPSIHSFPEAERPAIQSALALLRDMPEGAYLLSDVANHANLGPLEVKPAIKAAADILQRGISFAGSGREARFALDAQQEGAKAATHNLTSAHAVLPTVDSEHVAMAELGLREHDFRRGGTFAQFSKVTGVPMVSVRAAITRAASNLGRSYAFTDDSFFTR